MKKYTIGKDVSNDIVINEDFTVSRSHAVLFQDEKGDVYISDSNSTNGTYVNGTKIKHQQKLNQLDVLKVGNTPIDWISYFSKSPQKHYTQYDNIEPKSEIPQESYFESLPLALYYFFIKIFIMPVIIVRKSVINLPKQKNLNTEFVVFYYLKQSYDALLILFWPACIIYFFYCMIEDRFYDDEVILYYIVYSYFTPLLIGLIKESLSMLLVIAVKLEEISRNIRK